LTDICAVNVVVGAYPTRRILYILLKCLVVVSTLLELLVYGGLMLSLAMRIGGHEQSMGCFLQLLQCFRQDGASLHIAFERVN
jgi:hypothetical protein